MGDGVIVSYNKLWKLLVDKGIGKTELKNKAGVTPPVMSKLGKGEPVHLEALIKICNVLQCDIGDVVEISFEEKQGEQQ